MNSTNLIFFRILLSLAFCLPQLARADDGEARMLTTLIADARKLPDLDLPSEAKTLGTFSNFHNALFRPDEWDPNGSYAALVVAHNCGGIRPDDLRGWIEKALKEKFIVLVLDSMRGNKTNCLPPFPITTGRRIKDAFDASTQLSKLPFVNPKKIYLVGFSQGGFVASLLASPAVHRGIASESPRLAATAGLYSTCGWPAGSLKIVSYRIPYLLEDLDRPVLMLMGAADRETPAEYCGSLLTTLKEQGKPIAWHIYPEATHCWDCTSLNGFSKHDFRGEQISYKYDPQVTEDSRRRVFEFFSQH